MESVLSAKLDRLAVGSILKQVNEVFLLSVLLMRVQIRISHRPLHILFRVVAEAARNERTMDGH